MPSRLSYRDFALAFALVLICAYFSFASSQFLSARNLSLLLTDLSITATLALGMLLVILPGHIDLSVGSGVGLIGGVAAVLVSGGELPVRFFTWLRAVAGGIGGVEWARWAPVPPWPAGGAMLCAFLLALVLWWGMGTLIVRERIPAFIITLGGLLIFKGLFWLVIQNHTIPVVPASAGGAGQEGYWLHLGSWHARLWQLTRSEDGGFVWSWVGGGWKFPVLFGSGNLYAMLTTSYLTPAAGFLLAGSVVALLVLMKWSGARSRRADGLEAPDGEILFLQLFVTAQAIFLAVLVTSQYRGVPLPALILAGVAGFVWVLTQHTPFGRYLYATGGNEEAALISGVPVQSVSVAAFTLMGGIVAVAGFMQTAYGGYSTTTVGDLMELDAVAACVIGGVSLKGGRGTVLGVLFGALIMACLLNGMTLLSVSQEKKFIARGTVLILAVWMDVRLSRHAGKT